MLVAEFVGNFGSALITLLSDVDICVDGGSNVTVKDLQNEHIMVTTEIGDCFLSNIQVNTR